MDLVLLGNVCTCFLIFFKNISVERLFGEGVTREDLNQYAIGETLDRIYEYGPTKLFMDIVLHVIIVYRFLVTYYTLTLQASVYTATMKVRKKGQ